VAYQPRRPSNFTVKGLCGASTRKLSSIDEGDDDRHETGECRMGAHSHTHVQVSHLIINTNRVVCLRVSNGSVRVGSETELSSQLDLARSVPANVSTHTRAAHADRPASINHSSDTSFAHAAAAPQLQTVYFVF
jgi:hypothetical protein